MTSFRDVITVRRSRWGEPYLVMLTIEGDHVFNFGQEILTFYVSTYELGGTAVRAIDADGFPYATLSTRLPETDALPEGVFYLKDWSENAPLASALIEAGWLTPAAFPPAHAGWEMAEAYRLTPPAA